jgi:hypothetical protein
VYTEDAREIRRGVRDRLLGSPHRIVYNNLSASNGHMEYFVTYNEKHLRIIDTIHKKIILNQRIWEYYPDQPFTCVIHKISSNIHIIAIHEHSINGDIEEPESTWKTNIGIDRSMLTGTLESTLYHHLFLCQGDAVSQISQFRKEGNLLLADVMYLDIDRRKDLTFKRRLINAEIEKKIYESVDCRYTVINPPDVALPNTPNVAWFDEGVVVMDSYSLLNPKLIHRTNLEYQLTGLITIYNKLGKMVYSGDGIVNVGYRRLCYMEYYKGKEMKMTIYKADKDVHECVYDSYGIAKSVKKIVTGVEI